MGNGFDNQAIRADLEKVLASRTFEKSARARDLLAHLVNEELAGRGESLKGFSIAVDVFGKDERFDAATDPLVRVHAGRLREMLAAYYADEGSRDGIRISVPLGSYRPQFEPAEGQLAEALPAALEVEEAVPQPDPVVAQSFWRRHRNTGMVAIAVLVGLIGYLVLRGPDHFTILDPQHAAQEKIARESFLPVVRVLADQDDPELSAFAERLVAALASFDTITTLKPADRALLSRSPDTWTQLDYGLSISRVSDDEPPLVKISLIALAEDKVLRVEEHPVDIWEQPEAQVLIARKITAVATPEGVIYADIQSRGALNPQLDCLIKVRIYYGLSNRDTHQAAYDCTGELAEGPQENGLLKAIHGGLIAEAAGKAYSYDELPEEPEDAFSLALIVALGGVDLAPLSARSAREVGFVYSWQGAFVQMREWFGRAYELNPNDTSIAASHGYGLVLSGEYGKAIEVFERAIEAATRHPTWWDMYYSLALLMEGRIDEAKLAIKPLGMKKRGLFYTMLNAVFAHREKDRFQAAYLVRELKERYPRFAADPQGNFEKRHYPPDLIALLVDSLEKSGL